MDTCLLAFGGTALLFSHLNNSTPRPQENRLTVVFLADSEKGTAREGAILLAKTTVSGLLLDFSLSSVFSLIINLGKQRISIYKQ